MGAAVEMSEPELSLDEVFETTKSSSGEGQNSDADHHHSWGFASVERRLDLNLSLNLEQQDGRMKRMLRHMNIPLDEKKQTEDAQGPHSNKSSTKLRASKLTDTVNSLEDDLALALEDVQILTQQVEQCRTQTQQQQQQQRRLNRYTLTSNSKVEQQAEDSEVDSMGTADNSVKSSKKNKKKQEKLATGSVAGDTDDDTASVFSTKSSKADKKKKKKRQDDDLSVASSVASSATTQKKKKKDKKKLLDLDDMSVLTEDEISVYSGKKARAKKKKNSLKGLEGLDDISVASSVVSSVMTATKKTKKDKKKADLDDISLVSVLTTDDDVSVRSGKKKVKVKVKKKKSSADSSIIDNAIDLAFFDWKEYQISQRRDSDPDLLDSASFNWDQWLESQQQAPKKSKSPARLRKPNATTPKGQPDSRKFCRTKKPASPPRRKKGFVSPLKLFSEN